VRLTNDERGQPYIQPITEPALRGILTRTCDFIRICEKAEVSVPPPPELVRDILSLGHWQFPPLLGVVEAPVMRADGTLLTKPGYDSATKLYYRPSNGLQIPAIPKEPTESDIKAAVKLVLEPLVDFPFASKADRANALATMFVPILRPLIDSTVPLAIFDKPQAGTGSSLLAEVISVIATGRAATMMAAPRYDEEWRKVITSLLLRGQLVVTIDNIEGTLQAPSLAAILTAATFQGRILGQSEMAVMPNCITWIVTGNNIRLGGDLPRRCIRSRMDAKMARPWLRDRNIFQHPRLIEYVSENRGAILAGILTIARAWAVAGIPEAPASPNLGGYESYCRVIGGVLAYMGIEGFLGNLESMYNESDTETPQWEGFLEAWHEIIGETPVTAAVLLEHIQEHPHLKDVLPDNISDIESKNFTTRLGQQLGKRRDAHYPNGYVLVRAGALKRAVTWQVRLKQETSLGFSLKSEVGEVATTLACGEVKSPMRREINEGKYDDVEGAETTSPNLPLASEYGEVDPDDLDDEVQNYADLHDLIGGFGLAMVDVMARDEYPLIEADGSVKVVKIPSDVSFRGLCRRCGISFRPMATNIGGMADERCPSCGGDVFWRIVEGDKEIVDPRVLAKRIPRALGLDEDDN